MDNLIIFLYIVMARNRNLLLLILSILITENAISQTFSDESVSSGFNIGINRMLNGAWCDYNKDGFQDIFIRDGNLGQYHLMLNNKNRSFSDMVLEAGLNSGISIVSGSWGDYNNDSWPDLILLSRTEAFASARSQLFKNLGDGKFLDVAPQSGLNLPGDGETPRFFDYDGDGDLDVIMPFYRTSNPPTGNHLFRNDGKNGFTDVTAASGISTFVNAEATMIFDYDNDSDLDLYLSATLYSNNSDGTFTDVTATAGLPHSFDEGGSAGDFNNDGFIDLLICEHPDRYTKLYKNLGNGTFQDVTDLYGLPHTVNWGAGFIDYDNDGWLDIWYGSMYNGTDPFTLFKNHNGQNFADSTSSLGLPNQTNYTTPAWADYDNDGDMDVAIGQLAFVTNAPILFENHLNNDNYIFVKVTDQNGNENQFGATIRIYDAGTDTMMYTKVVGLGQEYLSQNQYATHFGIPETGNYNIEVTFPSVLPYVVRLSKATNPVLGSVNPSSLGSGALNRTIEIRRDGRVLMNNSIHLPINYFIPSLSSVANNGIVLAEDSLSLAWELYNSGAHTYELEINRNSDFRNPLIQISNLTDTIYRTQFSNIDTLFWRVRVLDVGTDAAWSDVFTFATRKNIIPVFVSIPETSAKEGILYSYQSHAQDQDSLLFHDTLRYDLLTAPTWLTIDSISGVVMGKPIREAVGDTLVTILVRDNHQGIGIQSYNLRVSKNEEPLSVQLLYPLQEDALTLYKFPIPRTFIWTKSSDPDLSGALDYAFRIFGDGLDSMITGITDTSVIIDGSVFKENAKYKWYVAAFDGVHFSSEIDTNEFYTLKRVLNPELVPKNYALESSYPNPFNPATTIRFDLPEKSFVELEIYNVLGQRIVVLSKGEFEADQYEIQWRPEQNLASGVYVVLLRAKSLSSKMKTSLAKKITFLK
ncbi:T9SS type A sorting domain-containing protein [bacterium]|nr:T9SS type A sorting domain-containing protein [bacterium]